MTSEVKVHLTISRLSKLVVSALVRLYDIAASRAKRSVGLSREGTWVILYYHSVEDNERQRFSRQMDELTRIAVPVELSFASMEPGRHYVTVTFDDGFVSVLENAIPELKSRNIPSTVFVPSRCLGLHAPWLTKSEAVLIKDMVMSADQLRAVSKLPLITIGSHCLTHPMLTRVSDEEARKEIVESKAELEAILSRPVEMLSFPHGEFYSNHVRSCFEAGYKRVFSIAPIMLRKQVDDQPIGRIRVDPGDWGPEFRLKILGAYRWLAKASTWKKRIFGGRTSLGL